MTDPDLTAALREAGHDDLAKALEQKELGDRLRRAGRSDLADQLATPPEPDPPERETPAERSQTERDAEAVKGALQEAGAWPSE